MAARRAKEAPRKVRNLGARKASSKEAQRVKGGYIGETEKLKGGAYRDGPSNT